MIVIPPRKCVACAGSGIAATRNEFEVGHCGGCKGTGVFKPVPRIVYVAGPFRAQTPWMVELRVRAAEQASLWLWKQGVINLCPHLLGRHFDKEIPDPDILAGMLELAARCDGIVLLEGWERSSGSKAELAHMQSLGKAVFYDLHAVVAWARQSAS